MGGAVGICSESEAVVCTARKVRKQLVSGHSAACQEGERGSDRATGALVSLRGGPIIYI